MPDCLATRRISGLVPFEALSVPPSRWTGRFAIDCGKRLPHLILPAIPLFPRPGEPVPVGWLPGHQPANRALEPIHRAPDGIDRVGWPAPPGLLPTVASHLPWPRLWFRFPGRVALDRLSVGVQPAAHP